MAERSHTHFTEHPHYQATSDRWVTYRDVYAGVEKIKAAGTRYLPQPAGLDDTDYQAYKTRAKWLDTVERLVIGLTGMIFRKDADIVLPETIIDHLQDITLSQMSKEVFCKWIAAELLLMGRVGVLVDFSPPDGANRPYWTGFKAEQIINWRTVVNQMTGAESVVLIVLYEEELLASSQSEFEHQIEQRWRVLRLTDGVYSQQIYRQRLDTNRAIVADVEAGALMIPERQGQPLPFIPFQIFSPYTLSWPVDKSLIDGVVEIALAYYRHSADYEHGLHYTALPTLVISGDVSQQGDVVVGSQDAILLADKDAQAYFLEFEGKGLDTSVNAMEQDKREMGQLGGRLLEPTPDTPETATSVMVRQSGEASPLQNMTGTLSAGISQVLRWHTWWAGLSTEPNNAEASVEFNTDFTSIHMPAQEMLALFQQWQGGGISQQTYLWNLQQGERLPPTVTPEDEANRIATETPTTIPLGEPGASLNAAD